MPASLIGRHCQAPYFLVFVVITAWVTLLYVVGLTNGQFDRTINRVFA